MKPILFELFGYRVPSYSVLMVLGYLVALAALFYVTPKGGDDRKGELSRAQVWDLYIVMVVSSIIGSKFGHVLFEAPGHRAQDGHIIQSLPELFAEDPWHWMRLGEAGYVWYGGMIGALLTAVFYFYRRPHLRAALYSDAFAPAIMLGACVGRLGCLLAGCCYGRQTDVPWAMAFPGVAGLVHPTQLYDSLIAFTLGLYLLWRFPKRRFDGELIATLLMAYGILRGFTESFRGDPERGTFGPLSTSQLLSIPLFLSGAFLWVRLSKKGSPSTPAPSAPNPPDPAGPAGPDEKAPSQAT